MPRPSKGPYGWRGAATISADRIEAARAALERTAKTLTAKQREPQQPRHR